MPSCLWQIRDELVASAADSNRKEASIPTIPSGMMLFVSFFISLIFFNDVVCMILYIFGLREVPELAT